MPEIAPGLIWSLAMAFAALLLGSVLRFVALRRAPADVAAARRSSLLVWWILLVLLASALLTGKVGLAILFASVSLLALAEFHALYQLKSPAAPLLLRTLATVAVAHYAILAFTDWRWSIAAFPLLTLAAVNVVQILSGKTAHFLRSTGGFMWGAVLLILGLSHTVLLLQLPPSASSWEVGAAGWPLFVILLTECDDIAQALIGRRIGRIKLVPKVSPGKTWEGFLGGMLVTVVLAVCLAPGLTSLAESASGVWRVVIAIGAGLTISVAGFFGDVNMSALKREAGVKDSGTILPGMGGILDRIDSLTFTAPAIYYYSMAIA